MMKKLVIVFLVVLLIFAFSIMPVMAGGDKVHGDKAEGPATQVGECPFGGENAGENNAGEGPHK